jgi:hypothetical protein
MSTTVERFYVDHRYEHESVHFEENGDLTVQLLRGGQRDAEHAQRGVVLVYLGVDDQHSQVSLQPQASRSSEEVLTEAIERLAIVREELQRLA